jgi:hypothetical protein
MLPVDNPEHAIGFVVISNPSGCTVGRTHVLAVHPASVSVELFVLHEYVTVPE